MTQQTRPDHERQHPSPSTGSPFRIGHGWDLHRLNTPSTRTPATSQDLPERPLILAGVHIPSAPGPISHSDGDVVFHALTDALLGALALPDIGELFPNTAPEWESAESRRFVAAAAERVAAAGFALQNLDATVILQAPRLAKHKPAMRTNLAVALGLDPVSDLHRINIKAKSHEHVDAVGEGRAVEAHAVVLLTRRPA